MNKQLELEAEDYLLGKRQGNVPTSFEDVKNIFIAEATSNAAKEYWYEKFKKEKLKLEVKKYIIIKADINDGDYVSEKTLISDEEIVRVKEILTKMPKTIYEGEEFPEIRYETKELGNDDRKNSNYNHITYEEKQFLNEFLPIGDANCPGIHTIVGVEIVQELEKLL